MDIIVGYPGSSHDSVIFDPSNLRMLMERSDIPGLLLGDNAYRCRPILLTSVLQLGNQQETRYNFAHRRMRHVERLFGTWKKRLPCLRGL